MTMRRVLPIILFLFLSLSAEAQNVVYICSSAANGKFHVNRDCGGLRNCGGTIKSMSLQKAESEGHLPCKRCAGNIQGNTREERQGSTTGNSVGISTDAIELAKSRAGVKAQVICHVGYTTSYNSDWLIPNWVAYDLTKPEVDGTVPRPKREFEPDPLAKGKSAEHRDYTNSGYSRGHMAPAADMKWSEQAMNESFYLSNVCPQIADLNGGVWQKLENRVRALATEATVYVCCGPVVGNKPQRIGENGVAVPDRFFKVLCMQRKGRWQAVGFVFPNSACRGSMFDYAVSVDEVESLTGHDFFHNLPDEVETAIESAWKMKDWQ